MKTSQDSRQQHPIGTGCMSVQVYASLRLEYPLLNCLSEHKLEAHGPRRQEKYGNLRLPATAWTELHPRFTLHVNEPGVLDPNLETVDAVTPNLSTEWKRRKTWWLAPCIPNLRFSFKRNPGFLRQKNFTMPVRLNYQ